jgi:Tol biopolymer transport system component
MKIRLDIAITLALLATGMDACDRSVDSQAQRISYQLVFSAYGPHIWQGIYALDEGGTSIKRLTPDSLSVSYRYSCSPDGESILFSAYWNQNADIWKITRANRVVTRVVSDPSADDSPQWLYDGSGFVFRSNRTGRYSLWMCDANGANPRQVVPDTAYTSWPISSPRRPLIAFSYSFQSLVVLDYERGLHIPVTPDSLKTNSNFFAWSTSGDKLAFEIQHDLYTWDVTRVLQRCWTDSNYIFNPAWSPSGQQIAFNALDTLKVLDLPSRMAYSLTSGMAYAGRSSWSPDGRIIALEAQNPPRIVLVAADGSSSREIPMGENAAVAPQWINAIW